MFCKECGTENNIQNAVCNKCGAKLKNSNRFYFIYISNYCFSHTHDNKSFY